MSKKDKYIDKDLFQKWQQESADNLQQLNVTEMEKLLKRASSDFSDSVKKTLKMDMIFKSCMIAGFLIVLILFIDNSFVLITSILFTALGTIGLFTEKDFLKRIRKIQAMEQNVSDLIREELKFYRSNLVRYPSVLSLSIAMFYVLGSMVYHAIKYGFIRPFRDINDVLVLAGLLILGMIISISANFPFFRSKINNLEALADDLENEEKFRNREREIRLQKQFTLTIFLIIGLVGIIALIYIITQL
jgi:hypothetical protein